MASEKLKKYLMDLAQDVSKKNEHLKNPKEAMEKAGIEPAHQDLIMKGDLEGVKKVVGSKDAYLVMSVGAYYKD
jgi:hypothetical protein